MALSQLQAVVVMDTTGVGMVVPIISELARAVGATPTTFGLSSTFYGIGQFLGAPVMGSLSDKYGRKKVLLLSLLNTAVFYCMSGYAPTFASFLLCRAVIGFGKQTMTAAQAYISDTTTDSERTAVLGRMHAFAAVGFIGGPILGSFLSKINMRLPTNMAALLYVATFLFALKWLPEAVPIHQSPVSPSKTASDAPSAQTASMWPLQRLAAWFRDALHVLRTPVVGRLMLLRMVEQAITMMMQSVFLLYVQKKLEVDPSNNGFILGYFGLLGLFTQMFALPQLVPLYSESTLTLAASGGMALAYALMTSASDLGTFIAGLSILQISHGIVSTCLGSAYTKAVPQAERGRYLGLSSSLESLLRVALPTAAGAMLQANTNLPFTVSGIVSAMVTVYLYHSAHPPAPVPATD